MDTRYDWDEQECCASDVHAATSSESATDTTSRGDNAQSDARPVAAPLGRVMVIGFRIIRV